MMSIATHLIKVKGEFDSSLWNENLLETYVIKKIKEIEDVLHPDLELFSVKIGNKKVTIEMNGYIYNEIEVWLYVCGYPSEVTQKVVEKWAKDHIIEEGLFVKKINIDMIYDMTKPLSKNSLYVGIERR